jgi:hypothetical protein
MRNPARRRNIALLSCLTGAICIAAAWLAPEEMLERAPRSVLGMIGLVVAPLALMAALFTQVNVRRRNRIMRGEGVIARWRIDAQRWKDFVTIDAQYTAQDPRFRNDFSILPKPSEPEPEIIVIADAIQLDGDLHRVPRDGFPSIVQIDWLDSYPACLNFQMAHGGGEGQIHYFSLRFPIAPGAETDARRVVEHFSKKQTESAAKPA